MPVKQKDIDALVKKKKRVVEHIASKQAPTQGEKLAVVKLVGEAAVGRVKKITDAEIEQAVRDTVGAITDRTDFLDDKVIELGVQMIGTLRDKAIKTRCWGVCG